MSSTEEQKAYQRAYYLKNKDKILARQKARPRWHVKNKDLAAESSRLYQQRNAEKIADRKRKQRATVKDIAQEYARQYHVKNADHRNAKSRAWHAANKKRVLDRHSAWAKKNSHICAERTRRRDAMKLKATPAWANREAIQAIYEKAAALTRSTGVPHAVDHIVPLQGKTVCGLHHEGNLQILTRSKNSQKYNSFPEDGILTVLGFLRT